MSKKVCASMQPCCLTLANFKKFRDIHIIFKSSPHIFIKGFNKALNLSGHTIMEIILNKPSLLIRSNAYVRSMKEIYNGIFCSLHFSCSWRTEKSYQLLIILNEVHTVIPDIHNLQVVVVEWVLHVQRCYPQYLREKYLCSYCSKLTLLCFYTEWLF